ncbi:MAG: hypothetical protein AB1846_14575 [Chloroflexota bacterium]
MPQIVFDILEIAGSLIRFVGLLAFGLGIGWFTLHTFKEANWQLKIAVYLGFVGLGIAFARFLPGGALGAFAIGAGGALLMWGMQKEKKPAEAEE